MRLILFLNVLNAANAADFVTEDQKAVGILSELGLFG